MILEAEHLLRDARTDTVYAKLTNTAFGIGKADMGGHGACHQILPAPRSRARCSACIQNLTGTDATLSAVRGLQPDPRR